MSFSNKIYTYIRVKRRGILKKILNIRLKNKQFIIISSNCWGHEVYNYFDLPYLTPFVGLYLYAQCYIKLLKNFEYLMNCELAFIKESKYGKREGEKLHPIGLLNGEVEIHFLHYESEKDALEKWNRRKQRMSSNINNYFFKFDDQDKCNEELINEFHKLPFKNKISFSKQKYSYKNNFLLDNNIDYVSLSNTIKLFDIAKWLNKQKIRKGFLVRVL